MFPAVSVTAMNDVGHDGAGLASGVLSTAHELGAALGVAVLAAIAGSAPAAGFADAFAAAAAISVVLAGLALVALPAVRPAGGARVAPH